MTPHYEATFYISLYFITLNNRLLIYSYFVPDGIFVRACYMPTWSKFISVGMLGVSSMLSSDNTIVPNFRRQLS